MSELALDHVERHALARELDGMGVAELLRREAAADTRLGSEPAKLNACIGAGPGPPARRAVDDAQQRPDRQLDPGGKPGLSRHAAGGVVRCFAVGERERVDAFPGGQVIAGNEPFRERAVAPRLELAACWLPAIGRSGSGCWPRSLCPQLKGTCASASVRRQPLPFS